MCSQKNWGGTLKETVLWTNPSQASSFSGQSVTLSDSLSKYDYVKIRARYSTTSSNSNDFYLDIDGTIDKPRTSYPSLAISEVVGSYTYSRAVLFRDNTTIEFGSCYRMGASGDGNAYCIPIEVIGCKL